MTLQKDPRSSWIRDVVLSAPAEEAKPETVITTADVATMYPSNRTADPFVYELAGPAQSYFELPLDWFSNMDGHLSPSDSPGAVRLIQRVHYKSFCFIGDTAENVQARAAECREAVSRELKASTQIGYIWWRLYPTYEMEQPDPDAQDPRPAALLRHKVRMRLGTLPALPTRFWLGLSKDLGNISSEPLVPRG